MAEKDNKSKKQENSKNKKSFFKDFKAELKKVIWPTPKQLVNNTVAVITIVLITAVIVFVLDVIFEAANTHGIEKIKEVISTNETTENTTTENNTTEDNTTSNESAENETTENEANSAEGTNTTESNTENTNTAETTDTNVTE